MIPWFALLRIAMMVVLWLLDGPLMVADSVETFARWPHDHLVPAGEGLTVTGPFGLLALVACSRTPPPSSVVAAAIVTPDPGFGTGDTTDPELRALLEDWWQLSLCSELLGPVAVRPGRCFAEGAVAEPSPDELHAVRSRLDALDDDRLDDLDHANLAALRWTLDRQLAPPSKPQTGTWDYVARLGRTTGEAADPRALHRAALDAMPALQDTIARLGAEHLGTSGFDEARDALRGAEWFYEDVDELAADMRATIDAGRAAVVGAFPRVPEEPCKPGVMQGNIASYGGGKLSGHDGVWWADITPEAGLPRYALRPQGFHECWPGHHFQLNRVNHRSDLPRFRRLYQTTAYLEGWATYAEQHVAVDLGLYGGWQDELGLADYELWRQARIAVDSGLYSQGWFPDQARSFLLEQTLLPPEHVEIELVRIRQTVGRMVGHGYGLARFREARAAAQASAGPAWDPVAYDVYVFEAGPLPFPVLIAESERWGRRRSAP